MLKVACQFSFFILLVFLVSCSVSRRVVYNDGGGSLPDDFMSKLRPQETNTEWVVAQLGEPLFVHASESGVEAYSWGLSRAQHMHMNLLIVLNYNVVEHEQEYFHLISKDSVVQTFWLDNSEHISKSKLAEFAMPDASNDVISAEP